MNYRTILASAGQGLMFRLGDRRALLQLVAELLSRSLSATSDTLRRAKERESMCAVNVQEMLMLKGYENRVRRPARR